MDELDTENSYRPYRRSGRRGVGWRQSSTSPYELINGLCESKTHHGAERHDEAFQVFRLHHRSHLPGGELLVTQAEQLTSGL